MKCALCMLLFLPLSLAIAQPPDTLWTLVIDGAGENIPSVIRQTSDGGYVVVGSTRPSESSDMDINIAKLDSSGNLIWQRTFGAAGDERADDVRELSSGGYIITGYTTHPAGDSVSIYLLKLSTGGDSVLARTYQECAARRFETHVVVINEGFLTSATAYNATNQVIFRMLIHMSLMGDTLWTRMDTLRTYLGRPLWDTYADMEPTPDGGCVIVGERVYWELFVPNPNLVECHDLYLYRCDGHGVTIAFDRYRYGMPRQVSVIDNDSYMACLRYGYVIRALNNIWDDYWWERCAFQEIADICAISSTRYIVLRTVYGANSDITLTSYSGQSHCALQWTITFGGAAEDSAVALAATRDNGYVIVGSTTTLGSGEKGIFVIKTRSDPLLSADKQPSSMLRDFAISSFPNPFNPSTTLSFTLPRQARARLAIYDVLGREVRVLADESFPAGEHRVLFDGSDLPSGIYFARLQSGEFVATQKLLLLK